MLNIPFYRVSLGNEEIEEVIATLKSGWLTTGPKTKQFEAQFAEYLKHKHALAVNSCTAALHLALEAIGLKRGQGVILPTMTFAATAEVVRYFGAKPILADCRADDFNLDVADAERRIQSALAVGQSIKAIIPVHYGGQIGDVAGVQALAGRYHLKVIEDAAHCCPAYYRTTERHAPRDHAPILRAGREPLRPPRSHPELRNTGRDPGVTSPLNAEWLTVGSSAEISCFSFYANKTITTGEGGMACTQNDEHASRMRIMSLHGLSRDAWKRFTSEGSWYYEIIAPGYKYNMTDVAAAIGIHQLHRADQLHRKREYRAQLYSQNLGDVEELVLPRQLPDRIHSWHLYAIRLKLNRLSLDRAQLITELQKCGIGTSVHWMPLHLHPYYRDTYGWVPGDFPIASSLYPQLLTLPLYPAMTEDEVTYVCDMLKNIIGKHLAPRVDTKVTPANRLDVELCAGSSRPRLQGSAP